MCAAARVSPSPTCSCSFSFVRITLNSLLTTEVWVKSRDPAGTEAKEAEGRPSRRYILTEDAPLRTAVMDLSAGALREDPLMREEDAGNLGESPKIFW